MCEGAFQEKCKSYVDMKSNFAYCEVITRYPEISLFLLEKCLALIPHFSI